MNLQTAKKQLSLTKAEQDSLNLLKTDNTKVLQMVALMNFTSETIANMQKKGIPIPSTSEEITELIDHIANIYSAAYKSKDSYMADTLYKDGTKDTSTFTYIPGQFVLANRNLSQAKQIKGSAIKFVIGPDLPKINIGPYLQDNSDQESLFLIPPFVKYTLDEATVDDSVDATYTVERDELPTMPEQVYQEFQEKLLNGWVANLADVTQSREYDTYEKFLIWRSKSPETPSDEQKKSKDELRSTWLKKNAIDNRVQDFYYNLRILIQGACRQREIEYDQAVETVQEQDPEFYTDFQNKRNEKLARDKSIFDYQQYLELMQQYTEAQGVLTTSINSMYQNFSTSFKKHIESFNEFGLPFKDKRRIYSMLSKFADLKLGIQKKFGEEKEPISPTDDGSRIEQERNDLSDLIGHINDSVSIIERENNTNYFDLDRQNSFRRELFFKAEELIKAYSVQYYSKKVQELAGQKVGIIGFLRGDETLRHEKLENNALRLQLAKTTEPQEQQSYSLRNTLSNLYIASKIDMPDFPTDDISAMYNKIKDKFQIDESTLVGHDVQQKLLARDESEGSQSLSIQSGRKVSSREMASYYRFQNEAIQRKITEGITSARTFDADFLPYSNDSIENIERSLNAIMANLEIDIEKTVDPATQMLGTPGYTKYYEGTFTPKLSSRQVNPEEINPQVNNVLLEDYEGEDIEINM